MFSYNPQLRVEINEILPDGSDLPFQVDFLDGSPQNFTINEQPIHINCSINNTLGASQNTATITISNTSYIEDFRSDPQAEIAKLAGKRLRVRIWAWYDNNIGLQSNPQPFFQPVYVGDIIDGFAVRSRGINDSSVQFKAQGHGWLATSGKLKTRFAAGSNYLDVVTSIMTYFIEERGQGQENNGSAPQFIIDDSIKSLEGKILTSSLSINRNPMETLNDISRDLDYTWGVHNNIPYMLPKAKASSKDSLLIADANLALESVARCSFETGMKGVINYSSDGFSFNHNYDRNIFIGRTIQASDEPQTGGRNTFVAGRVDSCATILDNKSGHSMSVDCSYLKEYNPADPFGATVSLPERRADNSGLRSI